MNRDQARSLIRQTFTQAFDKGRFLNFSQNLLNRIDASKAQSWNKQYVKNAFRDHINRYERLGTYTAPDRATLDVLIVYLTEDSKLERARTAIRNFVADHLKTRDEKDAAVVAFVSPSEKQWRFSYVKMEYATVQQESGKIGVETRLTPARRFSYIVGEGESCHTAQTRFVDLLQDTRTNPSLASIEEAFSVEAVTREFFHKYAELFNQINDALETILEKDKTILGEFSAKQIKTEDFAKKLMGQIVFLYFLQKKGWLGVEQGKDWGTGPHDFMRRLANGEYGKYENFFNDVLEPLFYDTLATDRGHEAYCSRFKRRIPFLNGGLFEPLGDYDWENTDILIPNRLFSNDDFVEEGISGTGVLDIFDRYNFTVNEAEPLEKEVAIDPEMLGKVFENLIEDNRRKGLGAFYTPREIVHYMCQESLINYLDTATRDATRGCSPLLPPREDIEVFIHIGEQISHYESVETPYKIQMPKTIEKNARLMDEALEAITACDPAVGSGAFLVGMMTEIVRARSSLTPFINKGLQPLVASTIRTPYFFKRHAIQNSLYGVDIDPGAVEIAKLRLWLSLVVDEEDVKQIKPLPNLDYKIVVGNSLLGIDRDENQITFEENDLNEIEKLKRLEFDESDQKKKNELKSKIDKLIDELTDTKKIFDFEIYFSEVFQQKKIEKDWKTYHITWVTHNSRISGRMVEYEAVIRQLRINKGLQPLVEPTLLNEHDEVEITGYLTDIIRENRTRVLAYNICRDHVHLVLVCEEEERDNLVRKMKRKTTHLYKLAHKIENEYHLWAQKYSWTIVKSEEQLYNTIQYIQYNREKHGLPCNKGLQPLVEKMITSSERAYNPITRPGGFDVVVGNPPYVRQEKIKEYKSSLKKLFKCYSGVADIYVYFYERGFNLLRDKGVLAFITSNKYMRAGYGEKLRQFLTENTRILQLIDFGDAPVFEATAYPSIIILQKGHPSLATRGSCPLPSSEESSRHAEQTRGCSPLWNQEHDCQQVKALSWERQKPVAEFERLVHANNFLIAQRELTADGWRIEIPSTFRLLEKLRNAGQPLGDYVKGRLYYGIKTGLNEAFVVDRATRDRLIAEHPSSSEVLKPFLRGRDVKRWRVEFDEKYLIKIESSENRTHPWSKKEQDNAQQIFAETYPAIHDHLMEYRDKLIKRDDKGKYFWELRSCKYWKEFEQPKIIIPAITNNVQYAIDNSCFYSNDKTNICVTDKAIQITGLLNSKLLWWCIRQIAATRQNNYYEFKPIYVTQLPISTGPQYDEILKKVDQILTIKDKNPKADVSQLEREIDRLVYDLYGLTPDEIKLVEESVGR